MKNEHSSGNSHEQQVKKLHEITADTLLEVIDTLDRIDANNKDIANKTVGLGKTNNRFQKWMIGLTVIIVILTAVTIYVAHQSKQPDRIYINGKETIQTTD